MCRVLCFNKLAVFAIVTCAALCAALDVCEHGVVNQGLCQKTCFNESCSCTMSDQTDFSSCSQSCHFLHSCPGMTCTGRDVCDQKCFFGKCDMSCHATDLCSQSCVWESHCHALTCTARICHQICSDCSMTCPPGVERCEQMCVSGVCDMECHAKTCRRTCREAICNVIGYTNAGISSHVGSHGPVWMGIYFFIVFLHVT
ncbi:keratin-associated protein 5-5 [Nematostella vectensis]|uniref:keratin-associated protein 5-5 n=1 Tax=Nematostella vectensis TaxID=45351 RepID=UPI00138FCADF|nr:keratin-associated protein 5-5 [Nematostella vectensis]